MIYRAATVHNRRLPQRSKAWETGDDGCVTPLAETMDYPPQHTLHVLEEAEGKKNTRKISHESSRLDDTYTRRLHGVDSNPSDTCCYGCQLDGDIGRPPPYPLIQYCSKLIGYS